MGMVAWSGVGGELLGKDDQGRWIKTEKHDRYVLPGCLEVPLLVVTDGLDTLEGRVRFLFFVAGP